MLRNYMGSAILAEAVRQGIVTEDEVDIVIDIVVYERTPGYLSRELSFLPCEIKEIYYTSLRKLWNWLCSGDFNAELLLLKYGWL